MLRLVRLDLRAQKAPKGLEVLYLTNPLNCDH